MTKTTVREIFFVKLTKAEMEGKLPLAPRIDSAGLVLGSLKLVETMSRVLGRRASLRPLAVRRSVAASPPIPAKSNRLRQGGPVQRGRAGRPRARPGA